VQAGVSGFHAIQEQVDSGAPAQMLERHPWLLTSWHWFVAKADLTQTAQQAMALVTSISSSIVQGSLFALLETLLILFFLFYFLRDQEPAMQRLRSLLPLTSGETDEFIAWQVDTVYATFYGTGLVGIIQGLLGGLMFWWLGLNAPVFWGIIMGILCILPIVGPSLVWGPAAILLALAGHWGKALILVAWGTLVIGLVGNLIYPILLGRRLRLHTLAVFISMVGGLVLFGACGFFVGPLVLAATLSLLSICKDRSSPASQQGLPVCRPHQRDLCSHLG
jgi:predicted PurR-regulated permease PerM